MKIPARDAATGEIVDAIRDLATGGSNAVGASFATLAPGAAETVIQDRLCTEASLIALTPRTASAAAATVWVKVTARGQFTLGHDASAASDRNLQYEIRRP